MISDSAQEAESSLRCESSEKGLSSGAEKNVMVLWGPETKRLLKYC
jgi:hypothetical protein